MIRKAGQTPVRIALRYDMRIAQGSRAVHEQYAAAIEQSRWADEQGFDVVRIHEHHGRDDGYLPAPVVFAAALASATKTIKLRFSVLVLPFHNPLRIAEDIAVLDQIAQGRVQLTVSAGYLRDEFEMFRIDPDDRVALLEEGIEVLRAAWRGQPFQYRAQTVTVTPRPFEGRVIPIVMGGSSARAARQAARVADGFEPGPQRFLAHYLDERKLLGKEPGILPGRWHELRMMHVSEDPERTWARIAPFAIHESNSYASWGNPTGLYKSTQSSAELRAPGMYSVVTPDQCYEIVRELGHDAEVHLHPLMGGMHPELGWESLELFNAKVMPRLRADGLLRTL